MANKEELQEAIARIQMRVDDAEKGVPNDDDDETAGMFGLILISKYDELTLYFLLAEKAETERVQGAHWTLGSRIRRHFTPLQLESAELFPDRPEFCGVDQKIRDYISQFYPEEGQNLTEHHTYRV